MGNQQSFMGTQQQCLQIPTDCKLYSVLPINSLQQQQQMLDILQKRMKISECPYICTIKGYDFINEDSNNIITCGQNKKLVVYYDKYQYKLNDILLKNYSQSFNQSQLCNIIKCIVHALLYLRQNKLHHGDISLDNIVKNNNSIITRQGTYRLVDKIFIKHGINAYQKVLQGQSGFISPKQMIKIRYGFVKQSPQITQADDVFSLGMVILQLASQIPSSLCYKQMNVRFNQGILINNIKKVKQKYGNVFGQLVAHMLQIQQDQRITLDEIAKNELIQVKWDSLSNINQVTKIRANDINLSNGNNKNNISLSKNYSLSNPQRKPITPSPNHPSHYPPTYPSNTSIPAQNKAKVKQNPTLATNNSTSYLVSSPSNSMPNIERNMKPMPTIGNSGQQLFNIRNSYYANTNSVNINNTNNTNININNNNHGIHGQRSTTPRLGSDKSIHKNYGGNSLYNSGHHIPENINNFNKPNSLPNSNYNSHINYYYQNKQSRT